MNVKKLCHVSLYGHCGLTAKTRDESQLERHERKVARKHGRAYVMSGNMTLLENLMLKNKAFLN